MGCGMRSRPRGTGLVHPRPARSPRLRLGPRPRRHSRSALEVARLLPHPHFRYLLWPGSPLGRLPQAPQTASFHPAAAFGHDHRLYGDYAVRSARGIHPAVSNCKKEDVPVTSQFAAWVLERIFDLLMALLV